MRSSLYLLALLTALLLGSVDAGSVDAAWAAAPEASGEAANVQMSFKTLDGDVQQVNVDEIWRVRATYTRDEPAARSSSTMHMSASLSETRWKTSSIAFGSSVTSRNSHCRAVRLCISWQAK